jgi:hypothetical protein
MTGSFRAAAARRSWTTRRQRAAAEQEAGFLTDYEIPPMPPTSAVGFYLPHWKRRFGGGPSYLTSAFLRGWNSGLEQRLANAQPSLFEGMFR